MVAVVSWMPPVLLSHRYSPFPIMTILTVRAQCNAVRGNNAVGLLSFFHSMTALHCNLVDSWWSVSRCQMAVRREVLRDQMARERGISSDRVKGKLGT